METSPVQGAAGKLMTFATVGPEGVWLPVTACGSKRMSRASENRADSGRESKKQKRK